MRPLLSARARSRAGSGTSPSRRCRRAPPRRPRSRRGRTHAAPGRAGVPRRSRPRSRRRTDLVEDCGDARRRHDLTVDDAAALADPNDGARRSSHARATSSADLRPRAADPPRSRRGTSRRTVAGRGAPRAPRPARPSAPGASSGRRAPSRRGAARPATSWTSARGPSPSAVVIPVRCTSRAGPAARPGRPRAGARSPPSRGGGRARGSAAVAPLGEEPRRPLRGRARARGRPRRAASVDEVAVGVGSERRDPRYLDAQPGERDGHVRLGARDAQGQRPADLERPGADGVEQRHRLADREHRHASGAR